MNKHLVVLTILKIFLFPIVVFLILAPFLIYTLPLLPEIIVKAFTTIACIYLLLIFIVGTFLGRAYCYYVCPMTGLFFFMACLLKNDDILKLKYPKWLNRFFNTAWFIGFAYLIFQLISPYNAYNSVYHLPSVMILYVLLLTACILSLLLIRNDDNHSMCPLIPFIITGTEIAKKIRIPRLHLMTFPEHCRSCNACNKACFVSLNVCGLVKEHSLTNTQKCFNCGQCSHACKFGAISYKFGK